MAISPLEARATGAQLDLACVVETCVERHLRHSPSEPYQLDGGEDVGVVGRLVAERFRRMGWHVTVDIEARRLIFNDATPEF